MIHQNIVDFLPYRPMVINREAGEIILTLLSRARGVESILLLCQSSGTMADKLSAAKRNKSNITTVNTHASTHYTHDLQPWQAQMRPQNDHRAWTITIRLVAHTIRLHRLSLDTLTNLACLSVFPPGAEQVDSGSWLFTAKYSKKTHETQNQTNTLLKGSITNPCCGLIKFMFRTEVVKTFIVFSM